MAIFLFLEMYFHFPIGFSDGCLDPFIYGQFDRFSIEFWKDSEFLILSVWCILELDFFFNLVNPCMKYF